MGGDSGLVGESLSLSIWGKRLHLGYFCWPIVVLSVKLSIFVLGAPLAITKICWHQYCFQIHNQLLFNIKSNVFACFSAWLCTLFGVQRFIKLFLGEWKKSKYVQYNVTFPGVQCFMTSVDTLSCLQKAKWSLKKACTANSFLYYSPYRHNAFIITIHGLLYMQENFTCIKLNYLKAFPCWL